MSEPSVASASEPAPTHDRVPWEHLTAGALLLLWLSLAGQTLFATSVTHDEIWHLPVGVLNWEGDFSADRLNPPLSRLWASLPLKLKKLDVSTGKDGSETGILFVQEHDAFQSWYFAGRAMHLVWGLGCGVLLYYWMLKLSDRPTALLGLTVWLAFPEVLAHSTLVTPDMPATFGFLLSGFTLWRWLQRPTWRRSVVAGLSVGFLQAMKFTGLVFYPVLVVAVVYLAIVIRKQPQRKRSRVVLGQGGVMLIMSLVVLAGSFGFQGLFHSLGSLNLQSQMLAGIRDSSSFFASFPLPLPVDYVLGIDQQRSIMEGRHPIFLDGVWQLQGFPQYYVMTLLYKLPHLFQALALAGLFVLYRTRERWRFDRFVTIWLPSLLLFGIASFSNMQLGMRYILPLALPLAMSAGWANRLVTGLTPLARWGCVVVVGLLAVISLRHHPQHLPYFNELAGGPVGGRYHLLDSNLDWGQDLWRVRDYLNRNPKESPQVLYYGTLNPAALGIQQPLPPSRHPKPGIYLVSVNFVMGRPHAAWLPDGTKRPIDFFEFGYFQYFEPAAHIGYSIDLYVLTNAEVEKYNRLVRAAQSSN